MHHAHNIEVDNFKFLQERIKGQSDDVRVKMTIPSPTMCHFRGGRQAISEEVYPDLDQFFEDLAQAYRDEIAALAKAGCKLLQLDDTNLAYLCDEDMRKAAAGRGEDLSTLPKRYAQVINSALKDKPEDMTVAIHLCRGNFKSMSFAQGGYEPIVRSLLRQQLMGCLKLNENRPRCCSTISTSTPVSDNITIFHPLRYTDVMPRRFVGIRQLSRRQL